MSKAYEINANQVKTDHFYLRQIDNIRISKNIRAAEKKIKKEIDEQQEHE